MPFCGEYSLTLFVQVVNYLCKIIISFVRVIRLCLMGTSGFIMFHSVRSYLERIEEKLRLKDVDEKRILKIVFRIIGSFVRSL